jgi:hypothetical protein
VIEGQQRVGDDQRHVGKPERVRVRWVERLDSPHEVVAEETHGAARKRRDPLDLRDAVSTEVLRDGGVGIGRVVPCGWLVPAPGLRRGDQLALLPLGEDTIDPTQHRAWPEAEERVAAHVALLRRLEQERGPVAAQLQERRHGRLAVLDEPTHDWNHVRVSRQLLRALAGWLETEPVFSGDGHSATPAPAPSRRLATGAER